MKFKKQSAILVVDQIESQLAFWETKLGYKRTVEVPHGPSLGFVILNRDGAEVMMQTHASLMEDLPEIAKQISGPVVIQYIEVDSIDAAVESVKGHKILVGPRTTPYGAKEIFLQDPEGFFLGFAEHG